jgi:hypothetical protein
MCCLESFWAVPYHFCHAPSLIWKDCNPRRPSARPDDTNPRNQAARNPKVVLLWAVADLGADLLEIIMRVVDGKKSI